MKLIASINYIINGNKMNLAKKLRIYLAENNMKKKDFAEKIGKHYVSLSDYTRGHIKKPHIETAKRIVDATNGYITLKDCGYDG